MLNRRALRTKAMQAIYAYKQSELSNFNLCIEAIAEDFLPDLLAAEPEDPEFLKAQKELAVSIFKESYNLNLIRYPSETSDRVKESVRKAVSAYRKMLVKDKQHFLRQMVVEVELIYDIYLKGLALLVEFANASDEELSKRKKIHGYTALSASDYNFVNNSYIQFISKNEVFLAEIAKTQQGWEGDRELVWQWFRDFLKKNKSFAEYLTLLDPDLDAQKALLWDITREVMFKSDAVQSYFESLDLNWAEDKGIVRAMLKKTIKDLSLESENGFNLMELSPNWEEDKEFMISLFQDTLDKQEEFESYFEPLLKNWDVDRIAITDRIILGMAIGEMLNFPSIPIKVTINEYIEISKQYSPPKSKQFINGILDSVGTELKAKGVLRKSGKGLIDNK
jgi:N utilization substance protein B